MYLGPAIMYGLNVLILFPMVIWYMVTVNLELTLYSLIPLPVLFKKKLIYLDRKRMHTNGMSALQTVLGSLIH